MSLPASAPKTLQPASQDDFSVELVACLRLCAPVGMSDDDRVEWVKVARVTIGHLPRDLLMIGCTEARKYADHPAKIVPIITRAVEGMLRARREQHERRERRPERQIAKAYVTPAEALRILEREAPSIAEAMKAEDLRAAAKIDRGPRRNPTREDYLAMGVTEDNLPKTMRGGGNT